VSSRASTIPPYADIGKEDEALILLERSSISTRIICWRCLGPVSLLLLGLGQRPARIQKGYQLVLAGLAVYLSDYLAPRNARLLRQSTARRSEPAQ